MTFLDLFSGIGGFRRGMELAGHKCIGFCEWDKFERASYISMHCITDKQREYLATLDITKRQKEILKEEYLNGEWCSEDIRQVNYRNIPKADCWCFGAPCQDFSVAGQRRGLEGDRSSLVREVFRILFELRERERPEWIIYENVKGMLSSNRGFDFLSILCEMDEGGYDIEWQVLNSKDFGVPQNRERVYTIGHLRAKGTRKIFPVEAADGENCTPVMLIGHRDGYHKNLQTYSTEGITETLDTCGGGGREHHVAFNIGGYADSAHSDGERLQGNRQPGYDRCFGIDKSIYGEPRPIANALTAREDRGISKQKQTGTAIAYFIGD